MILLTLSPLFLLLPTIDSFFTTCKQDDKEQWSYHGKTNGPAAWGELPTFEQCYGRNQSPINIRTKSAVEDKSLGLIEMSNYKIPVTKATVRNNGHSVEITPEDGVTRSVTVENSEFNLFQLHFHWGSHWNIGSEHTLDGKRYALEAHFVHRSANGSLAVVGVFFQEQLSNNKAFQPIGELLQKVQFKDDSTKLVHDLNLNELLPKNPSPLFRYFGSLTTPGCNEGVIWSVLKGVKDIGSVQLSKLRSLYSARKDQDYFGCKLRDNFRPLQPLNGRVVYTNSKS